MIKEGVFGQNKMALSFFKLSDNKKAMIVLFFAIVIWGGNWPVMKAGLDHITPLWFSFLRFGLGAATLFVFQVITKKIYFPKRADIPLILSIGLIQMMVFTALGSIAMTQVAAGRSAVLAYTTPLWVLPLAVLFFHESLSKQQVIGAILGMSGVLVLFNPLTFDWTNSTLLTANGMLLLAAFCWSLCILHLRYTKSKTTAFQLAPWQMTVASIPLACMAYYVEGPYTGDGSLSLIQICLYLGPLATAFCFCAVNDASRILSGTTMSTAMLGVPVIGLLLSTWALNETLTVALIIGTSLITGGIFCVIISGRKSKN